MFVCLAMTSLASGLADGDGGPMKVPAQPFECARAHSVCFDRLGDRHIALTDRGELLLWEKDAEKPAVIKLEQKPNREPCAVSAVLDQDGRNAILFFYDGRVQIWKVDAQEKVMDVSNDRTHLSYARLSPNGDMVACLTPETDVASSAVLFWDIRDGRAAGRIESRDAINDFCFSNDGRQVLTCVGYRSDQKEKGFNGVISWDLATKNEIERLDYGSGFPLRIAASPDGRWVATGGGDAVPVGRLGDVGYSLSGHLRVFDWEKKKLAKTLYLLDTDYVRAVQFSCDGKYLFSGAFVEPRGRCIAAVKAHRTTDWLNEWTVTLGTGNPHEMCVSPDCRTILVPDDEHLQIVDSSEQMVKGAKLKFRRYKKDPAKAGRDQDD